MGSILAHAQTPPPNPSISIDERRKAQIDAKEKESEADARPGAPMEDNARLPQSESPCFPIHEVSLVQIDGSAIEQRFDWLLDAASGPHDDDSPLRKCLGAKGVALVIKRLQDGLIARGFVTSRVVAQNQDLASGRLQLTFVPGRMRELRLQVPMGSTEKGVPVSIKGAVPIAPGEVLNLRDIEQGLENLKRVPTAQADIQIEPAKDTNAIDQSDVVIQYQQSQKARISLSADDSGSKGTGRYQGSATLSLDNPLGLSDLFYFTWSHDLGGEDMDGRGTRGNILHYSLPWGYWLLGTTVSTSHYYQTVPGLNQTYVYSGDSSNAEIKLSRLIYRDAVRKTSLGLKAWNRTSNNFIDDTEVLVQRRSVGGWELSLNHKDAIGAATVEINLSHKWGSKDFDAIPAPEQNFGEGTGEFGLSVLDLSLELPWPIGPKGSKYNAALRVQTNDTPLTPQDRFAIGGRYSVRGFDGESSLTGDQGWYLRNDWSFPLGGSGHSVYLGLDAGEVGGRSAENLAGKSLQGAVLGMRGGARLWPGSWQYDIFIGGPLGKPSAFRTADTTAGFSLSASW